jgi:hypothetical protein
MRSFPEFLGRNPHDFFEASCKIRSGIEPDLAGNILNFFVGRGQKLLRSENAPLQDGVRQIFAGALFVNPG